VQGVNERRPLIAGELLTSSKKSCGSLQQLCKTLKPRGVIADLDWQNACTSSKCIPEDLKHISLAIKNQHTEQSRHPSHWL
jgi:hypothetical protein